MFAAEELLDADFDEDTVTITLAGDPEVEAECITLERLGFKPETVTACRRFAMRMKGAEL